MAALKHLCLLITVLVVIFFLYISILVPQSGDTEQNGIFKTSQPSQGNIQAKITSKGEPSSGRLIPVWTHDLKGSWHKRLDICQYDKADKVTKLTTPFGSVHIHVHDPDKDIWVSRRIVKTGSFDLDKIQVIAKFLEADPSMNFIDIGANLGTYTLSFAQLGRKVLAVDALNLNIQKLCSSVNESRFENNVHMVMNAMSSRHELVNLAADDKNFGGTFVDQDATYVKSIKGGTVSGKHYNTIETIVFDDLLTLPFISDFSNVFIKMDIEGFEHKALERAYQFFNQILVQGIQIEWIFHKNKSTGQIIVDFLTKHSFVPYNPQTLRPLRKSSMGNWATQDVLWLRH